MVGTSGSVDFSFNILAIFFGVTFFSSIFLGVYERTFFFVTYFFGTDISFYFFGSDTSFFVFLRTAFHLSRGGAFLWTTDLDFFISFLADLGLSSSTGVSSLGVGIGF